jgi:hypothetical protein
MDTRRPCGTKRAPSAYLVARFCRSAAFTNLAPSSQKAYRLILDKFSREDGHRLVRDMPKAVAASIIEEIGATRPGMANLTASTLKRLFSYAVKMDMRSDNPFVGIDAYEGGEHRAWTDREIAAYEAKWLSEHGSGLPSICCCSPVSVSVMLPLCFAPIS